MSSRRRMGRINIEIPNDLHMRLKMIAAAEGKGFYEWLKQDLIQTCPDEQTLLQMLGDIREDRSKQRSVAEGPKAGLERELLRGSLLHL